MKLYIEIYSFKDMLEIISLKLKIFEISELKKEHFQKIKII